MSDNALPAEQPKRTVFDPKQIRRPRRRVTKKRDGSQDRGINSIRENDCTNEKDSNKEKDSSQEKYLARKVDVSEVNSVRSGFDPKRIIRPRRPKIKKRDESRDIEMNFTREKDFTTEKDKTKTKISANELGSTKVKNSTREENASEPQPLSTIDEYFNESSLIYCDDKQPYCLLCNCPLSRNDRQIENYKSTNDNIIALLKVHHVKTIEHKRRYTEFVRYYVLWNLPALDPNQSILLNNYIDCVYETRAANILCSTKDKKEYIVNELKELFLKTFGPDYVLHPIGSSFTGAELKQSDLNLELVHLKEPPGIFVSRGLAYPSSHFKLVDPEADVGQQINHHVLKYDLVPNAMNGLLEFGKFIYRYSNLNRDLGTVDYELMSNTVEINSKVPRIVMRHLPTNIDVEISSYLGSSHLSRILKWYLDLDVRAKKLSIFLKTWASVINFNNPNAGTLPSCAYVLLIIHYLQRTDPPILPCAHEIRDEKIKLSEEMRNFSLNKTDEATIDHESKKSIDCDQHILNNPTIQSSKEELKFSLNDNESDNDDADMQDNEDNISIEENVEEEEQDIIPDEELESYSWSTQNNAAASELLVGFFRYISLEFDYKKYIVSIRTLKPLTMKKKKWKFNVLAIEDPTRPSFNISRTIATQRLFDNFLQNFQETYRYLMTPPVHKDMKVIPGIILQDINAKFILDTEHFLEVAKHLKKKINNVPELVKILKMSVSFKMWDVAQLLMKNNLEALINSTDALFRFEHIKSMVDYVDIPLFCMGCRSYKHIKEFCPTMNFKSPYQLHPDIHKFYNPGLDKIIIRNWIDFKIDDDLATYHQTIVSQILSLIEDSIKLDCKLELFGSAVNGLGQRTSDLDMCMTINDNPSGKGLKFVKILTKIVPGLQASAFIKDVQPILSAKVPIIKFQHIGVDPKNGKEIILDVDLSMYNQCACYNTKLIKTYCNIDNRVAPLCFIVRTLVKACGVCEAPKGSLSSYAWTLMVIHFLQRTSPPILPCLQELCGSDKPIFGVSGWNVWFYDDLENIKNVWNHEVNDSSITKLYSEFLQYYSNFNFSKTTISIRKLEPMPRPLKKWNICRIAIEDPFELTWNLGSRVDDKMACFIQNIFPGALSRLCSVIRNPRGGIGRLFDARLINNNKSPPIRGCHKCGKIGHIVRHCPDSKPTNQLNHET